LLLIPSGSIIILIFPTEDHSLLVKYSFDSFIINFLSHGHILHHFGIRVWLG